ncbi:hypothetical protein COCNU_16G004200 [Cocos nucifera]|uniref:Uncharacterized protein n=1 Tax=Cocos nucifera TaxID=13894 RepID=A0A8K0IY86_COCNU|nr:hypothetical protein COCNU_16G004200 [Cocos nucifera]
MAEKKIQRASFGFSWADEVEREEREEEKGKAFRRKEEKSNRKSDPFGAARPREVVLEEKGVDWRKLDEELDYRSNLRKNKGQKENMFMTTPISKQEHSSMELRNPNQSKREIQNAITVRPQKLNQHIDELVPPLKYPPKNIMAVMEQIRKGRPYEVVDNLHLNRYPCNSDMMGHRNHWPVDASHIRTAQAHFSVNMTEAGCIGVCPKVENMGLNCKREYFGDRYQSGRAEEIQANVRELTNCRESYKDDDENRWDYLKDGTGRREKYIQGKRLLCAREKEQADGRKTLVDRNGRRNYDVLESTNPARKMKEQEGTRAKKSHDACSGDNNSKKRGLRSARPKSGSHQRRQKKQAGK